MHPRQRSPRGFYASEYRNRGGDGGFGVGVGFGRGYNNRRAAGGGVGVAAGGGSGGGDIFMEAGRLAAEYLVSQGLLPPNVLSLKWHNQNGSFKKHVGVGVGAGDILVDRDRNSALTRVGNSGVDGGVSGRRKLGFEEFGQKGRRRGSFNRSNGLDWSGREYRRNGSWSDRFRGGSDIRDDGDDDGGSGSSSSVRQPDEEQLYQQQQTEQVDGSSSVDNVMEKSNLNEFAPISEDGDDLDAGTNKDLVSGGELLELKETSPGAGKDACDMDVEFVKSSNDLENMSAGVKEVEDDGADSGDSDKPINLTNLSDQSSDQEDNSSGRDYPDLLSLCNSVKVPTKTRSSLTHKHLKGLPLENNGDGNIHDIGDLQVSEALVENESVKGSSSGDLLSDKTCELVNLDPNTAAVEPEPEPVHAAEDLNELDAECKAEEVQSIASQSGEDRDYMDDKNQESTAALPDYGSGGSLSGERGEKRVADDDDIREDSKRLREWRPVPSPIPKTEVYFLPNNPIEVKESPEEDEISHIDKVSMTSDQGNLMTMSSSQFTEDGNRPFFQCPEEKPSLPSSFRTCDLNLIEASEVHDNHVDHPVLIYPAAVPETKKVVPVGIDLSMNHASVSGKFSTHTTSGKEIEIIDLEDDCVQEKAIDSTDRKTEPMFQGLEGFSNHAQNAADIHDVQDGYGLMISELLGTDFANCSSVPDDINSVSEMGLDNGAETLAEDDSIYMSLGELSFLRPWEQPPPQDYQKHF